MKLRKCRHCGGTGKEIDSFACGQDLRNEREDVGISLRQMAKILNVSAPYLSDLELGRREWNRKKVQDYKDALLDFEFPPKADKKAA
jgi:predicted transcriptional regulator